MFTGIIQGLGQLQAPNSNRLRIVFSASLKKAIASDLALGDSVAVDGVCLTVTEITTDGFLADVSPETLNRSTLGKISKGLGWVNIETSLRVGGKVGGHFVTGHVDGIGCLTAAIATDNAWELSFGQVPELSSQWQNLGKYLVNKGSIAVNGISLTIAQVAPQNDYFTVAVIPHTYFETNLHALKIGDRVNLEGDILGKYVEKLLGYQSISKPETEISLDFLAEHGY